MVEILPQEGRKKVKSLTNKLASAAFSLVLAIVSSQAMAADSKKPIVIPTHNWSSQVVMAYVIGGIFKSMGNNVKYVPADTQAVYEAIRIGDVTISHEVWQSTFGASFQAAVEMLLDRKNDIMNRMMKIECVHERISVISVSQTRISWHFQS